MFSGCYVQARLDFFALRAADIVSFRRVSSRRVSSRTYLVLYYLSNRLCYCFKILPDYLTRPYFQNFYLC